jgi:SAM-dependent methyltransferase
LSTDQPAGRDLRLLVAAGYDSVAETYAAQRDRFAHTGLLAAFAALVKPGGLVLDIGVGSGLPVAAHLLDSGFRVVGIDVSGAMLGLARRNVPAAALARMDLTHLAFAPLSFDGAVAFYSLFHVGREHHAGVLAALASVLRPGAPVLFSVGGEAWEGVEDFHGARMFWSHFAPQTYLEMVAAAGFASVSAGPVTSGGETHFWITATLRA